MSDRQRTNADRPADVLAGHERDARVEEMLLAGLDHYFAARYEQAIHVWTRVLFLDRHHARARAYIERARSALAERQREIDELLHQGASAFESGEPGTARRLLTAAVERGAAPDVALAYLGRLDRLEPVGGSVESRAPTATAPRITAGQPVAHGRRVTRRHLALGVAAVVLLLSVGGYVFRTLDAGGDVTPPAILPVPEVSVPVPHPSDLVIERARRLLASGRARDALRLMSTLPATDSDRAEADRLLAEIQRAVLDGEIGDGGAARTR